MKKYFNIIIALFAIVLTGLSLTACSEDDLDTNQYKGGVTLNAWGANPVMRGGVLRFVGSNLDQIAQVKVPGVDPITSIEVVKSGVPSEIRITVPKDGPIPGKIVLVSKTDQTIETDNNLEFKEPIEIESFTPASAMPGQEITIKGDYLNLIHSLTFEEDVDVSENAFTAHSRYEIKVIVPEDARTGRISLNDVDVTLIDPDDDVTYNIMQTKDILEVGTPSIAKITSPRGAAELQGTVTAKAGEKITITGDFLTLVSSIKTGYADSELGQFEFDAIQVSEDGKSLSFTLPAQAKEGDINLVCKSGVEVPVCKLVTVAPSEVVVNGGNAVKNGTEITLTGKDLDVVANVFFPNVAEAIAVTPSATELKVTVPEKAQEGEIVLEMVNGKRVSVAYTLVKPTVTAYSANPVSAGGALSITGTDLDLVKTVTFNESENPAEVTVEGNGTVLNLTVPMDSKSGAVTLNLKNGADVTVADINVAEAVFCYATALPGEEEEIHAGETMVLDIKNGDKLTAVEIAGRNCQYIVSGNKLTVGVPDNAKKGTTVKLISSNGEISYKIDFIPNTEITTVIWTGMHSAGGWANGFQTLAWGGYDWSTVTPGTELVVNFAVDPAKTYGCQIRFGNGSWSALPGTKELPGADGDGNIAQADDAKEYRLTLTQAMIDEMVKNGGLVICGAWFNLTKVSLVEHISLEKELWKGEAVCDNWSNQPYLLSDAGLELAAAEAKPGQTIYFYITPIATDWKLEIVEGHWTGVTYAAICNAGNPDTEGGKFKEVDLAAEGGKVAITVTQAMLDAAYKQQWWGGTFIGNGDKCKITKITIE